MKKIQKYQNLIPHEKPQTVDLDLLGITTSFTTSERNQNTNKNLAASDLV